MKKTSLLLEDYIAELRVGLLDHERRAPQRVRVSVTAELKDSPENDRLDETYDYVKIIDGITALSDKHVDLLEIFGKQLAEKLLADDKIIAVEIELVKLDILKNSRVGVRYAASK